MEKKLDKVISFLIFGLPMMLYPICGSIASIKDGEYHHLYAYTFGLFVVTLLYFSFMKIDTLREEIKKLKGVN